MTNFNFATDYILEDDIICLRPLAATDFEHLLTYSVNEPGIWYFNSGGAGGPENLKKYIDNAITQRQKEREYPFVVFHKKEQRCIGSTRFYNIDLERKVLEVGFTWYGLNYQGTCINKNCKFLLFDFAFHQLGMERIGLGANSKNERSINAMKAVGCTVEGILRSRGYDSQGRRIDSIVLSILKDEWQNEWREKLKNKILK